MDWQTTTAAQIGRAIAAGADPVEVAEAFLDAIAAHPHGARIYARVTPERARAAPRGGGPLRGVPLSWKDLIDTAGTATEAGTALMRGRVPVRDAAVLRAATHAGTVCLGKTHLTEIAFSGLGLNPSTATPPNVHDPFWLPGGSSSGAAASVAFRLAPAAVGTDTGGSIRLPAAWNDLVGFKPAHGALSLEGVVPLCPSFDTVGPIARTVEDAALIFEALGGPATDLRGATLRGARIGVLRDVVGEGLDDAPARALDAALDRLRAAGAAVVPVALPDLARAYDLAGPLFTSEAWASWRHLIEPAPDALSPTTLARVSSGRDVAAADALAAWAELCAIRARARAALAPLDAVACATAAILPPRASDVAEPEAFRTLNLRALRNTRIANLLGLCSITIPTGVPACGLMLSALPGREGALLRLASAAE